VQDINQNTRALFRNKRSIIRNVSLSAAGIFLFAGFIHRPFPLLLLSIVGVVVAGSAIALSIQSIPYLFAAGFDKLNRKTLIYTLAAVLIGILLGVFARRRFDLSLLPATLTSVALTAPLVGAVEEIVFRGYIQGLLRPLGRGLSIVCAATEHTIYKLLVILSLSAPLQFDYLFLAVWTFIGGLLFGTIRELSGSTIPPMVAHAVFDIVLYGGMATAPLWVWS
jgi:membrane protease YdiL (CAAX protease family)